MPTPPAGVAGPDGRGGITADLVREMMQQEAAKLADGADERIQGLVAAAQNIFEATCLVTDWPQFFTNYAYDTYLVG